MSDEARAEAERRYPKPKPYPATDITYSRTELRVILRRAFETGAVWQASRPVETAPSDQPVPSAEEFGAAIGVERSRQIEKGYDVAHDDEHGALHLIGWAIDYARRGEAVKVGATLIALSELLHWQAAPSDTDLMTELRNIRAIWTERRYASSRTPVQAGELVAKELERVIERLYRAPQSVPIAPSESDAEALRYEFEYRIRTAMTHGYLNARISDPERMGGKEAIVQREIDRAMSSTAVTRVLTTPQPAQGEGTIHKINQEIPWPPSPESRYMLSKFKCSCGWEGGEFVDTRDNYTQIKNCRQIAEAHAAALGGGE